jgi:predicted deacetylase
MKPVYIVRLDDAHPRQFNQSWDQIEHILDELNIKPIVAIIPENQDSTIDYVDICNTNFWEKARKWRSKGWGIAVHGLHHLLRTGHHSILPISAYSEFSGKSYEEQLSMLTKAVNILRSQGCDPEYFVAPAHGFDEQTLAALRHLNPSLIVSDSFGFRAFIKDDIKFIPQQLWQGRWFPFGVWTICLHPSLMTQTDIDRFRAFARHNLANFMTPHHSLTFNKHTLLDQCWGLMYEAIFRMKRGLKTLSIRAKG